VRCITKRAVCESWRQPIGAALLAQPRQPDGLEMDRFRAHIFEMTKPEFHPKLNSSSARS
jgi:hypothetical protein